MKAPEYGINCLFRCPKQANLAAERQGRREARVFLRGAFPCEKVGLPVRIGNATRRRNILKKRVKMMENDAVSDGNEDWKRIGGLRAE